ncbi:MAG: urea ABC transporter permease subunit UrtB [Candidatus Pelethousia sp.]|nr:urea ABC transporter permease subunit UrtB [Candidatus Pelethousia sp.]
MLGLLIANGVNSSALLLLSALGLVIIMGHMKVVNLAHGELIMVGAYVTYYTSTVFRLPYVFSIIGAFLVTGLLGAAIERLVIRKLYGKASETLLATYALSLVIQQTVRFLSGPELKYVNIPLDGTLEFGGVTVPYYNLLILLVAAFALLTTWLLINKTTLGKQIRAITENRTMTGCLGINTQRIDTITFTYGTALAGLAGAMLAPIRTVSPFMGVQYLTDAFLNVVIGGLDSLFGTAFSAGIIGESITVLGGYWNDVGAKILVFFIIIILIRFKPEGLFAKERR